MQISNQKNEKQTKEYEEYIKKFTPKPAYLSNGLKAFFVGGAICEGAYLIQKVLLSTGLEEKEAGSIVTVGLICLAQLLTGLGIFDSITKFAGAGPLCPSQALPIPWWPLPWNLKKKATCWGSDPRYLLWPVLFLPLVSQHL